MMHTTLHFSSCLLRSLVPGRFLFGSFSQIHPSPLRLLLLLPAPSSLGQTILCKGHYLQEAQPQHDSTCSVPRNTVLPAFCSFLAPLTHHSHLYLGLYQPWSPGTLYNSRACPQKSLHLSPAAPTPPIQLFKVTGRKAVSMHRFSLDISQTYP